MSFTAVVYFEALIIGLIFSFFKAANMNSICTFLEMVVSLCTILVI